VINRNGDSIRRLGYAEGVMASHSNALGLSCNYRWETIDGQPRVVEHWTSDGEHFHFRYDFQQRVSWAVDVLGRELEVRYNEDKRVIASGTLAANVTASIWMKRAIRPPSACPTGIV
jgi:hypothetical protein